MLISQDIKNLVSGISQQPPVLRYPEQLEEQLNCLSSEAGGLQKRPPTLHIASLPLSKIGEVKPLAHFIHRDDNEQYMVVFNGLGIHVWDLQGNEKTVNYEGDAQAYLASSAPRKTIKTITVADYTFVLNTQTTVRMSDSTTPDVWATQGALVNVKSGQYGRTYKILVDGVEKASMTTPDGGDSEDVEYIDTNYIASGLALRLRNAGYEVTQGEGWLYFTGDFSTIDTRDGYNNQAMFGIQKTAQKFSILPATAPDGFLVEITGESGSSADNYYLVYDATDRVWKETARPGIQDSFDTSTMPHVLVREADGTFTFREAEWFVREIGDDDSNPIPSFIDEKINDIFFYCNRLGVVAGENIVLSKTSEFFQFWMATATDVLDTDPIDVAVSHNEDATLYHAIPFDESLLLFSKRTQFAAYLQGTLTPKNFSPQQTTEFGTSAYVRPVGAGRNVYFITERALYTSMKEYYRVQDGTQSRNAQDISSHVPSFIPNGVYKLLSNTSENLLLVLTEGEENSIFVYKYLFENESRIQSAWSKWSLTGGAKILGAAFSGSVLYLLVQRGDCLALEEMSFTYNTKDNEEEPYRVFLDRKVLSGVIPAASWNETLHRTYIDVKSVYGGFELSSEDSIGIVSAQGVYRAFSVDEVSSDGLVAFPGDVTGQQVTIGVRYETKVVFSTLYLKTVTEQGLKTDTEGSLYIRSFSIAYSESGYFKVSIEQLDKEPFIYEMTARTLGDAENILGVVPFPTDTFEFPVQCKNTECQIVVESPDPVPMALVSAGWVGKYHRRPKRV